MVLKWTFGWLVCFGVILRCCIWACSSPGQERWPHCDMICCIDSNSKMMEVVVWALLFWETEFEISKHQIAGVVVTSLYSPTFACSFPETTDLYYLVNRRSSGFKLSVTLRGAHRFGKLSLFLFATCSSCFIPLKMITSHNT